MVSFLQEHTRITLALIDTILYLVSPLSVLQLTVTEWEEWGAYRTNVARNRPHHQFA